MVYHFDCNQLPSSSLFIASRHCKPRDVMIVILLGFSWLKKQVATTKVVMAFVIVFVSSLALGVIADIEHATHSAHNPAHGEHFANGQHNLEFDHEAILGSVEKNREFEHLPPQESKRRLKVILDRMDKNNDDMISKQEISDWVVISFQSLNEEEARGKLEQFDKDRDNHLTWAEYLEGTFGRTPDELLDHEHDENPEVRAFMKVISDDKTKFNIADQNKDRRLTVSEFTAFLYPYNYNHMKALEFQSAMKTHDTNNDKFIDFTEYLGEAKPLNKEDELAEREQFNLFDKDGDGKLNKQEMKAWVLPDDRGLANEEADHLFGESDLNLDGKLTKAEIVERYDLWVGSAATNYGQQVRDEL